MRRPHSSLSELSWNIVIFVKTGPWVWWNFLLNTFNDTRITLGRWPLSYINVIYFLSVTVCLVLCGLCGTLGWGFRLTGLNPVTHVSLFQKFDKHIETVSDQPVIQAPPLLWTRALMTRPLWVVVMVQTTMTGFLSSPGVLPTSSSLSIPAIRARESYETQTSSVWPSRAELKEIQKDYMSSKEERKKNTQSGM